MPVCLFRLYSALGTRDESLSDGSCARSAGAERDRWRIGGAASSDFGVPGDSPRELLLRMVVSAAGFAAGVGVPCAGDELG